MRGKHLELFALVPEIEISSCVIFCTERKLFIIIISVILSVDKKLLVLCAFEVGQMYDDCDGH